MPIEINPPQPSSAQRVEQSGLRSLNIEIRFGAPKVTVEQRMVFTERLALLLETGVSLLEALKVMLAQTEEPELARVIAALAEAINDGKKFSTALAEHPAAFDATYVSLVAAAEEGGFLHQVLVQLLRMDEKNRQMRTTLVSAMSYPAFLVGFSVLVVVFVLVVIFPKFESMFETIHDQLPLATVVLMSVSSFVRGYWMPLLAGLAAVAWGAATWFRRDDGRRFLDRLKMGAPLIRDIYRQVYLSQTLSVLGLSLSNGVPVTVALKACQGVVSNSVFAAFLADVRNHVNEGRGIAIGFATSALVPPMVRQMVATGEQTGNLGLVMSRVADFYERELGKRLTMFSKTVEPILLMVMGVVVGLIVIALILPIFKLSRAMH